MKTRIAVCVVLSFAAAVVAYSQVLNVPDNDWRLWLDRDAPWENDTIFLPEDIRLNELAVRPPTGGWEVLSPSRGIPVTLPATVEQYCWGVNGFRPYNQEYAYESEDTVVKNGSYLGVSWWWRTIDVPASFKARNVTLFVRGARLRAEVYLNRILVGYNIITETSFTCDVSGAILPGEKNLLAVRITNPGGRLDWVDTELLAWGKTGQKFHKSHGFGGLDRGIQFRAHDPMYISDTWVLNKPEMTSVEAHALVQNTTSSDVKVSVRFEVLDSKRTMVLAANQKEVTIGHNEEVPVQSTLEYPKAKLWSNAEPNLYLLRTTIRSFGKKAYRDSKEVSFGFRWFEATGIGTNAMLKFNGRRIRLTSAISWGFWGFNGLWPTPELAEREVRAAKQLGLNCIQFHRNIGKAEMLDAQDRLGLMRCMEPGGGQTSLGEKFSLYAASPKGKPDDSGADGSARTFAERYMEDKIVRMVHDHRGHPSLLLYCIQNEIHPDLTNPRIFRVLRRINEEDPSRIVVLKSGFPSGNPSVNQAWMEPYSNSVHYDSGSAHSGWWDDHTVGGPGVWCDDLYKGPEDFTHRSTNDKEVVMWGEMLGAAAPDNHSAMVREIKVNGGKSYDLLDHEAVLDAYNTFLDRWGFRKAFPTADALFAAIGNKSYDFWGRVLEAARLAESNDYFVISGWESTAIENHSGLVDNLRHFKGDPKLIAARLAPLRTVVKSPSLVFSVGEIPTIDVYVLNETHQPQRQKVHLSARSPAGMVSEIGTFPVPAYATDRFVYPVAQKVPVQALSTEGVYTIIAELGSVKTEEQLYAIDPVGGTVPGKRVGIISSQPELQRPFLLLPGVTAEPYQADHQYDAVIAANRFTRPATTQVDSTVGIAGTGDQELYRHIYYGDATSIEFIVPNLPQDSAKVTLKFSELFQNAEGMRVFDVALNGQTVLKDFDVFKAAGGKNVALDRIFKVYLQNGVLQISFPNVPRPSARICAIKVEVGDTMVAVWSGGRKYVDRNGIVWNPYGPPVQLNADVLNKVRNGLPLLVLAEGETAAEYYAKELGAAGAFEYKGYVGEAFASWMGSWYFVRDHPVYAGLPVNCEMGSVYQVPVTNSAGVLVDGKDVEIIAAYSRDHDRRIGAGSFAAKLGKGNVVFHSMSGVVSGLSGASKGMHPVVLRRLLANSLRYIER